MNRILLFLTLTCLGITTLAQNIDDPKFWAYPEFYEISKADGSTKFRCAKPNGSRCVFQYDQFGKVHSGTGQQSTNYQGSAWAATQPDAVLTLTDCLLTDGPCRVTCNANCTCTVDGTNEPCTAGVSAAPTPSPVVVATGGTGGVTTACPQLNVQHCPELMQNSLPLGQAGLFDCYNFCGAEFVSSCSEGKCGSAACDPAGEYGSLTGIVTGCTIAHLDVELTPPASNSSAVLPPMVSTLLSAAFLALAVLNL